uniref:Uncharacterized protein n=1 Tax=Arundo donax TaxID=35708 RepID=A0A0A8Z8J5_ARUDO
MPTAGQSYARLLLLPRSRPRAPPPSIRAPLPSSTQAAARERSTGE